MSPWHVPLLQDMLPKHIAEALVEGRKIEPIVRDNEHPVTVFFSDIVGAAPAPLHLAPGGSFTPGAMRPLYTWRQEAPLHLAPGGPFTPGARRPPVPNRAWNSGAYWLLSHHSDASNRACKCVQAAASARLRCTSLAAWQGLQGRFWPF